ncbi:MAG: YceH family protein [Bacteroidetes bacterium]|nr:YceH family protein [Bacteroidota bacterium]
MPLDLTPQEARVLGVLIEKHLSTPDYYPLTLNATTLACNQKSNRNPVVDYSESEVQEALDTLHRKHLVGRAITSGGRATKYRHALGEGMRLQRPETAVLASLLLRGPQTIAEVRSRTSRMHDFDSIDSVVSVVEGLVTREEPLVVHLPRQAGQKEGRIAHLLAGEPEFQEDEAVNDPSAEAGSSTASRGHSVGEIQALRERIEALEEAFAAFRKQFE